MRRPFGFRLRSEREAIQGFVTAWCFVVNGIVTNAIGNLSIAYMIFACGAVLVTVLVSFLDEYKFNKDHKAELHEDFD